MLGVLCAFGIMGTEAIGAQLKQDATLNVHCSGAIGAQDIEENLTLGYFPTNPAAGRVVLGKTVDGRSVILSFLPSGQSALVNKGGPELILDLYNNPTNSDKSHYTFESANAVSLVFSPNGSLFSPGYYQAAINVTCNVK